MVHSNLEKIKSSLKAGLTISTQEISKLYWFLIKLSTKHNREEIDKPMLHMKTQFLRVTYGLNVCGMIIIIKDRPGSPSSRA